MLQEGGIHPAVRVGEALRHAAALYPDPVDPRTLLDQLGLGGLEATHLPAAVGRRAAPGGAGARARRPPAGGVPRRADRGRRPRRAAGDPAGRGRPAQRRRDRADDHARPRRGRARRRPGRDRRSAGGWWPTARSTSLTRTPEGGERVRFRAPAGLDRRALAAHLGGVDVTETAPGEYAWRRRPTPTVAALTAWLAEHDLPLADLRAGAAAGGRLPRARGAPARNRRPLPSRPAPPVRGDRTSVATRRSRARGRDPSSRDGPWPRRPRSEPRRRARRPVREAAARPDPARPGADAAQRRVAAAHPRHPGRRARVLLARRRAAHRRRRRRLPRPRHAGAGRAGHGVHQPRHRHRVRPVLRRAQAPRGHPARAAPAGRGEGPGRCWSYRPAGRRDRGGRARRSAGAPTSSRCRSSRSLVLAVAAFVGLALVLAGRLRRARLPRRGQRPVRRAAAAVGHGVPARRAAVRPAHRGRGAAVHGAGRRAARRPHRRRRHPVRVWPVLAVWAVAAVALAVALFRWEPGD